MGEAPAVKAQRLANESNERLAKEANDLNYQMFNEQNQWNLERRDEEWAHDDPSAQMERMIKAGINPITAVGEINNSQSQQLTSASSPPAERAEIMPEYDVQQPQKVANILGAAQNMSNSAQGFLKLALEAQDVQTRQRSQMSQEALNKAESLYKKAQTSGQEIFNNLNTRTFETQVSTKVAEYQRLLKDLNLMDKQGSLYDAELKNKQATYDQIIAMTNYTRTQADSLLEQTAQGWKRLQIEQQNADTNTFSAKSVDYYSGENLKLEGRKFRESVNQFTASLASQTNQQILDWCKSRIGLLQKAVGSNPFGSKVDTPFGSLEFSPDEMVTAIQKAGAEIISRFEQNPTSENLKSYQEYLNSVNNIPQAPSRQLNPASYDILNPSSPW